MFDLDAHQQHEQKDQYGGDEQAEMTGLFGEVVNAVHAIAARSVEQYSGVMMSLLAQLMSGVLLR